MAKKQETTSEKAESKLGAFTRFSAYVEASRLELRKITWPSLKETKRTSLIVLGFTAVMAVLLGLVDLGLSSLIKAILS